MQFYLSLQFIRETKRLQFYETEETKFKFGICQDIGLCATLQTTHILYPRSKEKLETDQSYNDCNLGSNPCIKEIFPPQAKLPVRGKSTVTLEEHNIIESLNFSLCFKHNVWDLNF